MTHNEVRGDYTDHDMVELKAINAELLEALRNLLPIGSNDGPLVKVYAKEIEAASEAIAKAEGPTT